MFLKKVGDIIFQDLSFTIILIGETLCFFYVVREKKDCGHIRYRCLALNVMFPPCIIFSNFHFLLFYILFSRANGVYMVCVMSVYLTTVYSSGVYMVCKSDLCICVVFPGVLENISRCFARSAQHVKLQLNVCVCALAYCI